MNPDRMLRLPELRQILPLSESRVYQLVALGKLARPVRIGLRAVAWRASDVQNYLDRLIREDALRQAGTWRQRGPGPKAISTRQASVDTYR